MFISDAGLDRGVAVPAVRRVEACAIQLPGCERHGDSVKGISRISIPAAAGLTASLTLFMLWMAKGEHALGRWKWVLPALLIFLSFMMFSRFQYPSFKGLNWRTTRSIPRFIAIVLLLGFTLLNYYWMPAVIFLAYLLYGFLRPFLSRRMQREIGEEILEEDEEGFKSHQSCRATRGTGAAIPINPNS